MAKLFHVKKKAPWKSVNIPRNGLDSEIFESLIDIKVLNDYNFDNADTPTKKTKKQTPSRKSGDKVTKEQKNELREENVSKKQKKSRVNKNQSDLDNDDLQHSSDIEGKTEGINQNINDTISTKKKGRKRKKQNKTEVDENTDIKKQKLEEQSESSDIVKKKKGRSRKKKSGQDLVANNQVITNDECESNGDDMSSKKKRRKKKRKNKTTTCDTNNSQNESSNSNSEISFVNNSEGGKIKEKGVKGKRNKNSKKKSLASQQVLQPPKGNASTVQADGKNASLDMSKWLGLHVPDILLKSLQSQGFDSPTTIQALGLPSAIRDHQDILAAAETGSGKTLAFGIPLIAKILSYQQRNAEKNQTTVKPSIEEEEEESEMEEEESEMEEEENEDEEENKDSSDASDDEKVEAVIESSEQCNEELREKRPPLALILEPTRELAVQVHKHLSKLAKYTDIKFALVVGGMAVEKQRRLLKRQPEVIIATPGRLWQLIQEGDNHLSDVDLIHCLVVDEADRMIEKGHYEELGTLLLMINESPRRKKNRQSFVMSATLTMEVSIPKRVLNKVKDKKLEKDRLKILTSKICVGTKPKVIDLTPKNKVAQSLTEMRINCNADEKDYYLYYFLCQHPGRTLVFANSKDCLRRLVSVFNLLECSPYPLHADMQQRQRLKNLDRFAANSQGLLLASDVAARGLDIPNVDYVLHYQVPKTMENYVHRSGRTARASNVGLSVMLVGPEDASYYRKIVHGVKNGEELPIMPLDMTLLPAVKQRVELARTIDVTEYRAKKVRLHNDFFSKAAEEMDMILDDSSLIPCDSDHMSQSREKHQLKALKEQLSAMIKRSLAPLRMSKYPTKSGQLVSKKKMDLYEAT